MNNLNEYRMDAKDNLKLEMLKRDEDTSFLCDPGFQEKYIDYLFRILNEQITKIESNQITNEEFIEFQHILSNVIKDLEIVIKFSGKVLPYQFILLIHTICLLKYFGIEELFIKYIPTLILLVQNYPELVDFFLNSQEIQNYVDSFTSIFLGWELSLLSSFLTNSPNAASILISNGLLNNIINTFQASIPQTQEQKSQVTDFFIHYWISAISSLEKIALNYFTDQKVLVTIFQFSLQFLNADFFSFRPGFVFKVIDCLSACLLHLENFNQLNFKQYLPFFMNLLFNKDKRGRQTILNLFNIISRPPFFYQWDQQTILEITENAKNWLNENKKSYSYDIEDDDKYDISYYTEISLFFDFISNAISYQPIIYDFLNEISFFDFVYTVFTNETHKMKIHIINLFLSLTIPQTWAKSIKYFAQNKILTECLLFIDSGIDREFRFRIIQCLINVCSLITSSTTSEIHKLIIKELQSDNVSDILSNMLDDDDESNEFLSILIHQIHSLTV